MRQVLRSGSRSAVLDRATSAMDSPACTNSPAGRGSCGSPSAASDPLLDAPVVQARAAAGAGAPRYGPYDVVGMLGPHRRRRAPDRVRRQPPPPCLDSYASAGRRRRGAADPRSQPARPLALAERTPGHERGLGRLRGPGWRAACQRARRAPAVADGSALAAGSGARD